MWVMRRATGGFVGAGWSLKSPIRGTKRSVRSAVERQDIKDDRSLHGVRPERIPGDGDGGLKVRRPTRRDGPLLDPASDACGTNSVLCYIPSRGWAKNKRTLKLDADRRPQTTGGTEASPPRARRGALGEGDGGRERGQERTVMRIALYMDMDAPARMSLAAVTKDGTEVVMMSMPV
jgi:hypothetical protein